MMIYKSFVQNIHCYLFYVHVFSCTLLTDWCLRCSQSVYLIFEPLPFYPLTTLKIKILKKQKKHLDEMPSFYTCVPKIIIKLPKNTKNHVPLLLHEIWRLTDISFLHFGPFFIVLSHKWHQKLKFAKKPKKNLETLSFYKCV